MYNYDDLPSRGKIASDGEKVKNHGMFCGGRIYISYEEDRWYLVHCEHCGEIVKVRTDSMDMAIKIWNDMPDMIGYRKKDIDPQNFYFTFGTDGQLFYAGYVKIIADSLAEAQQKFIDRYGDQAWKKGCLNYAFSYNQEQFETLAQFSGGPWSICHEVIQ